MSREQVLSLNDSTAYFVLGACPASSLHMRLPMRTRINVTYLQALSRIVQTAVAQHSSSRSMSKCYLYENLGHSALPGMRMIEQEPRAMTFANNTETGSCREAEVANSD